MTAPRRSTTAAAARPVRVQLSRAKGWRLPPNTVKVDRSTRWGNPFHFDGREVTRADAIASFAAALQRDRGYAPPRHVSGITWNSLEDIRRELHGRNLACWCPLDGPCHADLLLKIARS